MTTVAYNGAPAFAAFAGVTFSIAVASKPILTFRPH